MPFLVGSKQSCINMKLELKRRWLTADSTIGELYVDGAFECYVLEDVYRGGLPKVSKQTAIPVGEYVVKKTFSERFQRMMYLVMDVPGFSGIRIHSGNTAADTEGCLLVGTTKGQDQVLQSRSALLELSLIHI